MTAAGAERDLVFYSSATPGWLPRAQNDDLFNEYFVAMDGPTVRGAYAMKVQRFQFPDGDIRSIGYYHHALSEGIVNKAYASVGALLLRDAMQRYPLLYCLGMAGYDRPLPKMLIGLGWSHALVPFYFRIVSPYRFLRQMQALRTSTARALLMDLAAFSGSGWLSAAIWRAVQRMRAPRIRGAAALPVNAFAEWADALWGGARAAYGFTAVRDASVLRHLYPASAGHLDRLRITCDGEDVGWAVVGERRRDSKYGAMRVGSLVDCWALPGREEAVVATAAAALEDRGMDLILTNQSHPGWRRALRFGGFAGGPSNFIFAASRRLSELLKPFDLDALRMHLTRADGDGLPQNY